MSDSTRPPNKPTSPPPPPPGPPAPAPPSGHAELLDTAALLVGSVQLLVDRKFGDAFAHSPAELGEVKHSLKFLRRALEDLGAHSLPARQAPRRPRFGPGVAGEPGPNSSREGTVTPPRLCGAPGPRCPQAPAVAASVRGLVDPGDGRAGGALGAATQTFTLPRPAEFQIGTAAITRT